MELTKKLRLASILCLLIFAESVTGLGEVSIYNIYYGTLIYSYYNDRNQYIACNTAYQLSGKDYPTRATWTKTFNSNKSVSFTNKQTGLCLSYYYKDYKLIQESCNFYDSKQQFKIELVLSGAYLLKHMNSVSQCIHESSTSDSTYSSDCVEHDDTFHWALIPAPYPGRVQYEQNKVNETIPRNANI